MFVYQPTQFVLNTSTSNFNYADIFWSSTDNTGYATQAQYVDFRYGNVAHYERTRQHLARCVRDGAASTSMVSNILSNDLSFEYPQIWFWAMPPSSITSTTSKNNIVGDEASTVNSTLWARLRIAKSDHGTFKPWSLNVCGDYSEPENGLSGWRLPTQRELQAIWILQDEIKSKCVTFNLLSDEYYWSGTNADVVWTSGSNAWTIYGGRSPLGGAGNVPHQLKETPLKIRCVRELQP